MSATLVVRRRKMKLFPLHLAKDLAIIWFLCWLSELLFKSLGVVILMCILGFVISSITREQRKKESYIYFPILGILFWISTAPVLIPGEIEFPLWFASVPVILGSVAAAMIIYAIVHITTKNKTELVEPDGVSN